MRTLLAVLAIWTGVAFALVVGWVLVIKLARRYHQRRDAGYARDAAAASPPREIPRRNEMPQAAAESGTPVHSEDDLPSAHAVVRAWTDSGQDPRRHAEAQWAVWQANPDLADALNRLAEESRHRRPS